MKYVFTALIAVGALVFLAAPATADWEDWEPHKMHFPQLPDRDGWDVPFGSFYHEETEVSPGVFEWFERNTFQLADDWQCSGDGDVTDIHFWVSRRMYGDDPPQPGAVPFKITRVNAAIYGNIPAEDNPQYGFSMPDYDNPLWDREWEGDYLDDHVQVRWAGEGDQGWYDPASWTADPSDHRNYYQVNITGIDAPFFQYAGEIYWLGLLAVDAADTATGEPVTLGWKTADTDQYPLPYTGEHFEDDAVYQVDQWDDTGTGSFYPEELWINDASRDLAFVITPEPGTVAMLLGAGLMGLLAYARRRRKQ